MYSHQINKQIISFYANEAERGKDQKESSMIGLYSYGKPKSISRPSAQSSNNQSSLPNCSNSSACEVKASKLVKTKSITSSNLDRLSLYYRLKTLIIKEIEIKTTHQEST